MQGLREFIREYFDWKYRYCASKFQRSLALPWLIRRRLPHRCTGTDGPPLAEEIGVSKIRLSGISYRLATVVPTDIMQEPKVPGYQANTTKEPGPDKVEKEWVPEGLVKEGMPAKCYDWEEAQSS